MAINKPTDKPQQTSWLRLALFRGSPACSILLSLTILLAVKGAL